MKKIRVLIIEDSKVVRELLGHIIGQDPRFDIAAAVGSAEEAFLILDRVSPDVISMDIRLPGMNGLEATRQIMAVRPTPIVVVSASLARDDMQTTINALQAGALTVLEKPAGTASGDYEELAQHLCTQLAIMSAVKVVRRRTAGRSAHPVERAAPHPGVYRMTGIVCSTGGPNALAKLLGGLGTGFPMPIALVQHITGSFLEGFASWLENVCPFTVVIVKDHVVPTAGSVYLAPPDRHLRLESGVLRVDTGQAVSGQRPSGTALFASMAQHLGDGALGVLLTGMGQDGAEGLRQMRNQGGHTIAEHESTAVVYGMPGEAVRLGAVCESLPLPAIAPRILSLAWPIKAVAS